MNVIQLEKYCGDRDIIVNTYQKAAELLNAPELMESYKDTGVAIYDNKDDFKAIFYNENLPPENKYLVFAHELSHHVLGHLTGRKHKDKEIEADVFASVLMALYVFSEMAANA